MNRSVDLPAKQMVGLFVRLLHPITTRGGAKYKKGSRWRIDGTWRGKFTLVPPDYCPIAGPHEVTTIRHVRRYAFEVLRTRRQ